MKRVLAILLALMLVLSLAACNNESGGTNSGGGGTEVEYPTKDITIIVPYAAGGTADLMARALSTQLSTDLGVNVVVQNVEGGGGTTGTSQAVNSTPDGYTLALPSNAGFLINPSLNEVGYTYDSVTPVCMLSEVNIAIAVAADSEYQTLEDLTAKENVTYSSPGANSAPHLLAAGVAQQAGVTWNHSPNSSSPAAIAELIGHHIDFFCVNIPTFKSSVADGTVRLLAVTGDERDPDYPDVPTFKELGYDFPASVYFCLLGPGDMDPEVTKILSDAVGKAMENQDVKDAFTSLQFPMHYLNTEDFAKRVPDDYALYEEVLKGLGIL